MGKKPVCNLDQFKSIVKKTIIADMKGIFKYKPIFLEGPGGIGKTSSIYQLHKELEEETGEKFGFYQFDVGTRTANDLWGIPYPIENQEGGNRSLEWIKEGDFPSKNNPKTEKYGIFFITELTSVQDEQMKVGLLDLLSNRRMVGYELPDNWYIVADGNRRQDGNIYEPLTFPVRNRLSIMEVEFDKNTWLTWAEGKIHPKVIEFVDTRMTEEEYLTFNANKEKSYGQEFEENYVCATPRSWESVSQVLYMNEQDKEGKLNPEELFLMVSSLVGDDVGRAFIDFLEKGTRTDNIEETESGLGNILNMEWNNNTPKDNLPAINKDLLEKLVNLVIQDRIDKEQKKNVIYYILYNEQMGFKVPNVMKRLLERELIEYIKEDAIKNNNLKLASNFKFKEEDKLSWS